MSLKRIQELEKKIAALKKRWPKHSVPPGMLLELDELEEALAREREKSQDGREDA